MPMNAEPHSTTVTAAASGTRKLRAGAGVAESSARVAVVVMTPIVAPHDLEAPAIVPSSGFSVAVEWGHARRPPPARLPLRRRLRVDRRRRRQPRVHAVRREPARLGAPARDRPEAARAARSWHPPHRRWARPGRA